MVGPVGSGTARFSGSTANLNRTHRQRTGTHRDSEGPAPGPAC